MNPFFHNSVAGMTEPEVKHIHTMNFKWVSGFNVFDEVDDS